VSDDKGTTAKPATPAADKVTPADTPPPAQTTLDGGAEPLEAPNDTPPKRARRKRADAGKPRGSRARTVTASTATIRKRLAEVFSMVGGVVSLLDAHDGRVILANAEPLADGWAKVAERHPRMRQALEGFEAGGVYGAAIVSTVMVVVPIMAHHRMIPPNLLGAAAMAGVPVETAAPSSGTARATPPPRTGPPPATSGAPVGVPVGAFPSAGAPAV